MAKRTRILALILLTSLIGLSACAYRPPVQQGNLLSQEDLHAIHRGMSSYDVIHALGNPVLSNVYLDGRMVYIYTLQHNGHRMQKRQLIVTFRSGRVTNYTVQSSPQMPT